MARSTARWQPALPPVVTDLDAELDRIAKLGVEDLRALWRERRGQEPPEAVSKDLTARALAHWLQEAHLGGLASPLRKLLASLPVKGAEPMRRVKVGSVIVREYQGKLHEVMVVPTDSCGRDRSIRVFQPSPSESPARAGAVAASSACETARARGLRQARRASQA